ncbi:MAG: FG-GAP-like repeat-containing protein [Pyrinomonadaceae bacterium]
MCPRAFSIPVFFCLFAAVSVAQNLKADYQFQGNLNSSVAGAPAMTNLGCSGDPNEFTSSTVDGYDRQVLHFEPNCGLAVSTAGVIPNNAYTIVMLFRFDEVDGFRRVVSFDNGVADTGGYILDGRLEFENTANVPFAASTYIQVVIVREATGVVRGYRDGGFRVNLNDGGTFQISGANMLRFFQDDPNPPTEAAEGRVARIRLYDAPMTTTQVRALDRVANATGGGDQPILFSSARDGFYEIYSSNADGSNQRRLTNNEVHEQGAKWSPNRQKIVYYRRETSSSPYQIWIMNADGTGQTRLTNTTTNDFVPGWKPDGSKILFSRCDASFVCDLFTMNPDGSEQTPIPNVNTVNDEADASFSPDGAKIAFVCSTGGATFSNQSICSINADGTNRQVLANVTSPAAGAAPSYSADGTKIAYARSVDPSNISNWEIFVMPNSGGGGSNITNNAFFEYHPIWSPDGQELAVYGSGVFDEVASEVYKIAADGLSTARLTENSVPDIVSDWYHPPLVIDQSTLFDYDGDGKADLSVRRPSNNIWYLLRGTAGYTAMQWGVTGDRMAPSDYDGDGATDVAVFRPSDGKWYIFMSQSQTFQTFNWGASGDLPVPTDKDGDGSSDLVLFRPSNNTWYTRFANGTFNVFVFGVAGDKPLTGDFDGDGKGDFAIFRPSNSNWYIIKSGAGFFIQTWGQTGDIPTTGDFDGDGATDHAVFRPSEGKWYLSRTTAGFTSQNWGQAGDIPVAADYDGDGMTDVAVFRPANATWYIVQSTAGILVQQFGVTGDIPTQSAFIY